MQKLVIFDCDGVLVDSEIIASRYEAEVLTSIGYPITTDECIRRFTGLNAATVRQIIFEEAGIEISLDFFAQRQSGLLELLEAELLPLNRAVLNALDERKVSRCVASSSSRTRVIRSLELTKQYTHFNNQSIFTSQQVSKGKPAPDLFLFAAQQMGFSPENCIVVEDSPAGIQAAISAGMNVVGFLGGSHAKYDWYRQKLESYEIPLANDENELHTVLNNFVTDECLLENSSKRTEK
jgi:HAD superfamily hydrolase (TIGR01509 family)